MEKENLFMNESSCQMHYGNGTGGLRNNELNSSSEVQLQNYLFNPSWENSMDQNDPIESALSSMVSSPGPGSSGGENVLLGELVGRLGSVCNSGEISPEFYVGGGNKSTNTSCYSTPLNWSPKINLSIDHQVRGNLQILGRRLPSHPSFASFPTDPGFAERAARFSCFANEFRWHKWPNWISE